MDGVPLLSQQLVAPGEVFKYEFLAHPAGTHFYHTHVAQLGLRGPFIVRAKIDPHRSLYDSDETVVFLSDLCKSMDESTWLAGLVAGTLMSDEDPESDLDWEDTALLCNGVLCESASINISAGSDRPRLRLINGAFNWAVVVSVDQHDLLILASDGKDVVARSASELVVSPGERYDVVLIPRRGAERGGGGGGSEAKRHAFRLSTRNGHHVVASLWYEASSGGGETEEVSKKVALRTSDHVKYLDLSYNVSLLRSHSMTTPLMPMVASRTMDMHLSGSMMEYAWSIDGTTWPAMDVEIDIPLAVLRGQFTGDVRQAIKQVTLNEVVDIQIHNPTGMQHPFHLHGHKFWVLGSRSLIIGKQTSPMVEIESNVWYAYKDTINVPPGRVISIRVEFDNPGPWLFHCHTSFHLARGMAVVFMVGNEEEQPVPPSNPMGQEIQDFWSLMLVMAVFMLGAVVGIACGCSAYWYPNQCPSHRCKGYKSVLDNDDLVEMTPVEVDESVVGEI